MKSLRKQKGMTGLGWLTILGLIGFFSLLTIKIGPIYLQHYTVKSVLMSLKEEPLITKKTPSQIKGMIFKRLKVNGVYDMDKKAVTLQKSPGIVLVDITYTVQKNMAGNLDILVNFSEQVELVSN
ncbi:DUF4845 domain-containing protein [Solemya velesiana gill symbiont]|uniref:DUF4845 domain-containing protein n=1 Tax=Solemya velesiana gill symbiont TaxID=1918948 RepID=A0A1T2KX03_9GAMM|nr:DUF4845 domain-containing protein [Solemya velesiana gill symbiont]OOZ37375.1 hypothetical protein BOW51_02670 [Solemya velesiana gill symbiont]